MGCNGAERRSAANPPYRRDSGLRRAASTSPKMTRDRRAKKPGITGSRTTVTTIGRNLLYGRPSLSDRIAPIAVIRPTSIDGRNSVAKGRHADGSGALCTPLDDAIKRSLSEARATPLPAIKRMTRQPLARFPGFLPIGDSGDDAGRDGRPQQRRLQSR